jgi:hypothetical protein
MTRATVILAVLWRGREERTNNHGGRKEEACP